LAAPAQHTPRTDRPAAMETGILIPVVVVLGLSVFAYSAFAQRIGHWHLTAPIVFTAAGWLIWQGQSDGEDLAWLLRLAETTLALVLFSDAAGVRPKEIGRDRSFILRLLFIGLPLTIVLGFLLALWLFPAFAWPMALLLAAMLAPTDAALGAATVTDPRLPLRVRRMLNVESGLNDGLATPVVLFAIAVLAGQEGLTARVTSTEAIVEIIVGILLGAVLGWCGGTLLRVSHERGWTSMRSANVAVLMIPAVAYFGADLVGGNGFIAAFIAGTAFAATAPSAFEEQELELTEGLIEPLGYATWMAFGAVVVPVFLGDIGWRHVVFAIASLTVLRMVPVALSLLGTGLRPPTLVFVGWFGPRGLATVVFTLIAVESLEIDSTLIDVLSTATLTVLLSVVLHGITAAPWAGKYAAWVNREQPPVELASSESAPRIRGVLGRHHH